VLKFMATQPSNDDIARQAYLLWESEGCQHGSDVQYWLRAERLLNETSNGNGAGKSTKKNSKATFIPSNKGSEASARSAVR
jgi:hypothetical protein